MQILAIALLAATPEASPPAASERRLSPEQVEQVLEEAARKNRQSAQPASAEEPPEPAPYPVYGEVGFTIGTGGYRSVYGMAVVPVTGDATAIVNIGTGRRNDRSYWGW